MPFFSPGNSVYHLICETAGIFVGFRYFLFLRKHTVSDPIPWTHRLWILVGAVCGALLGSRLLALLEAPGLLMQGKVTWLAVYKSKTIVGGLLGGLAGVEIMKKIIREPNSSGDLFTYPLILAMMIGRAGCFLMGVYEPTYGVPSNLPWCMDLGDGVPRHPAALYEIIFLALLWLALIRISRRYRLVNGALFKLFMCSYLTFRFFIEFLKPYESLFLGLSVIHWAAIAGLCYYYRVWLIPKHLLKHD